MDDNISVLQKVFGVKKYNSGTLANLGRCPKGMAIDSVNANTDLNHRIIEKHISATVSNGDIMVVMDLPRKVSATMHVTVWIGFKPE